MITLKLKHWRTVGVAATALGLAACGGEGGERALMSAKAAKAKLASFRRSAKTAARPRLSMPLVKLAKRRSANEAESTARPVR
ncbi:MAG: hypothetical protein IPL62_07330 [Caulobacteraceae bacterium]|nr:hypothetical protein [Caulobacteraceae bacterium]